MPDSHRFDAVHLIGCESEHLAVYRTGAA
jgi:hypothetical protein